VKIVAFSTGSGSVAKKQELSIQVP
jgi:hypothetical protein